MTQENIFAYTEPGSNVPAFISINMRDEKIVLTARAREGATVDVELPQEQLTALFDALTHAKPTGSAVEAVATVAEIKAAGKTWHSVYPENALDALPIGTPLYLHPASEAQDDVSEQLRIWIWEQTEKHPGSLQALQPAFDLILNKIDEFRAAAHSQKGPAK